MEQLTDHVFHQIDLDNAYTKAVNSCEEMEKTINEAKNLLGHPEDFTNEHFDKIINKLDNYRDENKRAIDLWHEDCIDEIKMIIKKACHRNLKMALKTENLNVELFESNLEFWQEKLEKPELSNKNLSFRSINSAVDSSCLI